MKRVFEFWFNRKKFNLTAQECHNAMIIFTSLTLLKRGA